jgi:hypothetical protein
VRREDKEKILFEVSSPPSLLPGIDLQFQKTASFSWRQTPPESLFQTGDEIRCAKRAAGVRVAANGIGFCFGWVDSTYSRHVSGVQVWCQAPCLPARTSGLVMT